MSAFLHDICSTINSDATQQGAFSTQFASATPKSCVTKETHFFDSGVFVENGSMRKILYRSFLLIFVLSFFMGMGFHCGTSTVQYFMILILRWYGL